MIFKYLNIKIIQVFFTQKTKNVNNLKINLFVINDVLINNVKSLNLFVLIKQKLQVVITLIAC